MSYQYPPVDTELKGYIICVAKTDRNNTIVAWANVTVPARYCRDDEYIGYVLIDHSFYEYDIEDTAEVNFYYELKINGELVEGSDKITKIVKVIDEDIKREF